MKITSRYPSVPSVRRSKVSEALRTPPSDEVTLSKPLPVKVLLAGLAGAQGMVVGALSYVTVAIPMLEALYQITEEGVPPLEAAKNALIHPLRLPVEEATEAWRLASGLPPRDGNAWSANRPHQG